jgi:hypothetical protein
MVYPSQHTVRIEDNSREPFGSIEEVKKALLAAGFREHDIAPRLMFRPIGDDDVIDVEAEKQ